MCGPIVPKLGTSVRNGRVRMESGRSAQSLFRPFGATKAKVPAWQVRAADRDC
jgi:hypothetical protein